MPKGIKGFQKGYIPWDKGLKGIHLSPKTEFKKGHIVTVEMREKTRKANIGRIPWNKGKHPEYVQRENHPNWQGGEMQDKNGYIFIHKPSHPRANSGGYVKRSYLVIEQIIKRPVKKGEIVHHKGVHFHIDSIKNRQDDSPKNLQLCKNNGEHKKIHYKYMKIDKSGRFLQKSNINKK